MPPGYDVLIINKSLETSVTIDGDIDFMIVHSREADVQIQARGRYRGDLQTLYLYTNSIENELHILPKITGQRLFRADTKALCESLQIRDKRGRVVGWNTVKTLLREQGYNVSGGRYQNKQYYVIGSHEEVKK
jgi:SHS2 domain-containing protein